MTHIFHVTTLQINKLLEQILALDPNLGLKDILRWHPDEVEALLNPSNFDAYDEIISNIDYYDYLIEKE